ncbi:discoidin domain-containing protein [Lysinibacillus xylanilyticus]|uniref:discoidin domain-containing protein n=1 Tax=Lysinibacillus xylanilyticus TaxID=582475 RepID=UPI00382BFF05
MSKTIEYTWFPLAMTNNTTPSPYVATSSSNYSSIYNPYLVFDGKLNSDSRWLANAPTGHITIDFGSIKLFNCLKYSCLTIVTEAYPKFVAIQGSIDGTNFIDIATFNGTNTSTEFMTIDFDNNTKYRYYRFNIKTNFGHTSYTGLTELVYGFTNKPTNKSLILHDGEYKKFNQTLPSDGGKPIVPLMKSATQDGVTISQSSIDGYYGYGAFGDSQWVSSSLASVTSPQWVTVDFGEGNKKVVASYEARAYLGDRYITKHKFQGSNDNINFVDLFDTTEPMTLTVKRYELNNETAYRYYRIYAYGSSGGNGRASLSKVQFFEKPTPIIYSYWSTVSSTLPNATQFLGQGMDIISPLLDRTLTELKPTTMTQRNDILSKNEIGKIYSKTIDLKKYFDIRSIRTEVK